jgi:predicted RNA-binding protein (virulence factor B family)
LSKFFKISILVLSVVFTSCSKDLTLEEVDVRDEVVGRWLASDDVVGKTENQRVVTIFRVDESLDEVRIQNLVNTDIFFTVSLDDNGNITLTPSESNYVSFILNSERFSKLDNVLEMDYEFEGSVKETILEKR